MQAEAELEVAVVGGGVVGLAVARAFALAGRAVALLEAEGAVGTHTSSRSSEVLHAGFHGGAGWLKARLCVEGRRALEAYATARGVPWRRPGKLVVATHEAELGALEGYLARGRQNGVEGLELLDAAGARALEPEVRCAGALWSPATGIIDSHALLRALQRDAQEAGALVLLGAPVRGGRVGSRHFELSVGGDEPYLLRCEKLVNAAGLFAPAVARTLEGLPGASIPQAHWAKGNYFALGGRAPFRHLVYPVAVPGGLGVHVTLDLAGQARFGPDVELVERLDYAVDEGRAPLFEAAIRRYWPGMPEGALRPAYAGVRPKLGPPGGPAQDFLVQGEEGHGIAGLVNLYGIESPGLTACLALAAHVEGLLRG